MKQDSAKKLWIISGSSGVGKGTVLKAVLAKRPDLKVSISCTTRKKREGEVHGVNYFYITDEEFKQSIENDEFLEWAVYNGNYYGTPVAPVEKKLSEGYDVLLEIDVQGAIKVMKKRNDKLSIFIAPPDIETLRERLKGRGSETEEDIISRVSAAIAELEMQDLYDYVVVNNFLDDAVEEVKDILERKDVL